MLIETHPRSRATQPLRSRPSLLAIVAIVVALASLAVAVGSALQTRSSTPMNPAPAISPLSLAASAPLAKARDARLPPLLSTGNTAEVHLIATDANVEIASGVSYKAWTFDQTVPGPALHVRQGQVVQVTFTNNGTMQHSIDFHAAQVPPNVAYREVNPGDSIRFSFVATTPGVFLYHCGTPPVLLHIANGMYGAIVVDPSKPLPPADESYVLVQSEWYTSQAEGSLMIANWATMLAATPSEVVFNGTAFQYRDHPLMARAGGRVRLYVVDAGPNLPSAFHVIGSIFAAAYPDGDPSHALTGVSTYPIQPGEGAVLDLIVPQPGQYSFVDHRMSDAQIGAQGLLKVTP